MGRIVDSHVHLHVPQPFLNLGFYVLQPGTCSVDFTASVGPPYQLETQTFALN